MQPPLWTALLSSSQVSFLLWSARLERERVQPAPHLLLERIVNELVLLHAGFSAKRLRKHGRGDGCACASKVANLHFGIGTVPVDQPLDIVGLHRHCRLRLSTNRARHI